MLIKITKTDEQAPKHPNTTELGTTYCYIYDFLDRNSDIQLLIHKF